MQFPRRSSCIRSASDTLAGRSLGHPDVPGLGLFRSSRANAGVPSAVLCNNERARSRSGGPPEKGLNYLKPNPTSLCTQFGFATLQHRDISRNNSSSRAFFVPRPKNLPPATTSTDGSDPWSNQRCATVADQAVILRSAGSGSIHKSSRAPWPPSLPPRRTERCSPSRSPTASR